LDFGLSESQNAKKKGKLVVISGPSGAGKSTICRQMLKRMDAVLSVSATTRAQSAQETDGVDYRFITREEFLDRVKRNEFLEYAEVFGNLYGTPRDTVEQMLNAGKTVILEIDVQGGRQVRQNYPDVILIFIMPPESGELEKRLNGRARDSADAAKKRLEAAQREIDEAKEFYEYTVVNDDLEKAINEVINIIENKEMTK
jgi:guanylate kinase